MASVQKTSLPVYLISRLPAAGAKWYLCSMIKLRFTTASRIMTAVLETGVNEIYTCLVSL